MIFIAIKKIFLCFYIFSQLIFFHQFLKLSKLAQGFCQKNLHLFANYKEKLGSIVAQTNQ